MFNCWICFYRVNVAIPKKRESTRETGHQFHKSPERQKNLLGFDISLRDKYDRLLAYVWVEDEAGTPRMLNLMLLREELAELMIIEPDDKYSDRLKKAMK